MGEHQLISPAGVYGVTPKALELFDYIADFYSRRGYSPSYDQMKEKVGLASKSGIHRMVQQLEDRGFIRRLPNRARSITPQIKCMSDRHINQTMVSLLKDIRYRLRWANENGTLNFLWRDIHESVESVLNDIEAAQ